MIFILEHGSSSRRLYNSLDTHHVTGEVWQRDQLLAEPVVHQEPGQDHVQVKEVSAETN